MSKITEIIDAINAAKKTTFSFEITPNILESELDNLTVEPSFFSITWHAKTHLNKDLDIAPIRLAKLLKTKGKTVLLHLSCDLLTKDYLNSLVDLLKEHNLRNLLIFRGESFDRENSYFKTSGDLLKYIRDETGDYFCIGVVGFPDCSDEKLSILKNKIDKGADFIVTQAFFESDLYSTYLTRCKNIGINIPIIPGIFYFTSYQRLMGFVNMCKVKVSQNVLDYVKEKESTGDISGIDITRQIIQTLSREIGVYNFHFFTMDKLDKVCALYNQIKN